MPLLDIATAQASLQAHLVPLRAPSFLHCKLFSSPFTHGDEKRLFSVARYFDFQKGISSRASGSRLVVKAVATLEPKSFVTKQDEHKLYDDAQLDANSTSASTQNGSSTSDSEEVDEREKLRRMRISKGNKWNTPWNKGRKHSAETLRWIKEQTRLAMQNPKVRMKLQNLGHAQSTDTRIKIGVGVRMGWKKRRQKQMVQEGCLFEWQNLIAEASRKGCVGEEELQLDSYEILSEKLQIEWMESVEHRKTMPRPKGSKRAPKSAEQKRKIAAAIVAKWADPEYRQRVCSGLYRYRGTPDGTERKARRRPSASTQTSRCSPVKKKVTKANSSNELDDLSPIERLKLHRANKPLYNDPIASSKLELIKNIRAQRATAETKKIEAVKRARLLIAEAEKAAKALEGPATMSLVAQASLMETRKLIAEAVQSIQFIDVETDTMPVESLNQTEDTGDVKNEVEVVNGRSSNHEQTVELNGTKIIQVAADEEIMDIRSLTNFTLRDMLNGGKELLSAYSQMPSINGKHLRKEEQFEANGNNPKSKHKNPQPNGTVVAQSPETKKWVCGRLVEVTKED